MKRKVVTYSLGVVVLLLSLTLIGKNADYERFKTQIAKFKKTELAYQEEVDEYGNRITTQEQVILTQKEAIGQGLLEIGRLKTALAQVKIITETIIDTIIIVHSDTVVEMINGDAYLKLPQRYAFSDDFFSFKAEISKVGLSVDRVSIFNESTITLGYERRGLFKPLKPVVQIRNSNPYMQTTSVSNVVIKKETSLLHDKRAWGVVGLFIGIILK